MVLRILALTLGVILMCAPVVPTAASVGEGLTLDELVARADEIVHARALSSESRYEGGQIVTEIELERIETIRGRAGERLRLVTPGGAVGNVGMRVEGAPRVPVGEEAVLFARRSGRGVRAVGMAQGVFPIRARAGRPWVHPGAAGLVLLRRDASGRLLRAAPALSEPVELERFLEEVRQRAGGR